MKFSGEERRLLMVEEWVKLLVTANFLDDDFTRREAVTCFVQSKTLVAHEFKNRERFEGATFVDFLEAIARITLMKVRVKQHMCRVCRVVCMTNVQGVPLYGLYGSRCCC